jgi:hypothetical protein
MGKRFEYLNYTHDFWQRFVKNGELDEEALAKAGYRSEQFEGIRDVLTANEWIKPPVVKALEGQSMGDLKQLAAEHEIELPAGARKPEIVEALAQQVDPAVVLEPEEENKPDKKKSKK